MTDTRSTPASDADPRQRAETAVAQGHQVADTATSAGRDVAATAGEEARAVARTAADQAQTVGAEALGQARTVLDGATDEVREQLEQRLRTLAGSARTTADELQALVEGRPDEAGRTRDLAEQAGRRIGAMADRAEDLGVQGLIEEASDLARRRPVLFLAGAATAGILVGRLARVGREVHGGDAPSASLGAPPPTDLPTERSGVTGDLLPGGVGAPGGAAPPVEPGPMPAPPPLPPQAPAPGLPTDPPRPTAGWGQS